MAKLYRKISRHATNTYLEYGRFRIVLCSKNAQSMQGVRFVLYWTVLFYPLFPMQENISFYKIKKHILGENKCPKLSGLCKMCLKTSVKLAMTRMSEHLNTWKPLQIITFDNNWYTLAYMIPRDGKALGWKLKQIRTTYLCLKKSSGCSLMK